MTLTRLAVAMILPALGFCAMPYSDTVQQWRQQREAKLKADGGWLSLAGLFWLKDGSNVVGSDPKAAIRLARGPARVGVIEYHAGKSTFRAEPGVPVQVNGKTVAATPLKSDEGGVEPDLVRLADMSFFVIRRGERDAVRLKDLQSEGRTHFTGLQWYPIREEYRVVAKWVPYNPPKVLSIPNILGEIEKTPSPGYAAFTLKGKPFQLEPVVEDGDLFFVFKDLTAGKETYPPGRFLHADLPKDGTVTLDFNKSYNPPCAFTPYATCPLPTKENRMAIRIEAGELNYGHHQ